MTNIFRIIHNMETVNALITYNNCKIKGDISVVGTDSTDTGLGKVILGAGTTVITSCELSPITYDETKISTYDGSTSGVYLDNGTSIESTDTGYKVV